MSAGNQPTAMLNFKHGLRANLPQTVTNGTVYITSDERAMYVDLNGSRIRLGDFQTVAKISDLPASASQTALFYVEEGNVLAKFNGTDWIQINHNADLTALKNLVGSKPLTTDATIVTAAINEVDAHADAAQSDATSALTQIGVASKAETAPGAGDAVVATGLNKRLEDIETALGADGSVQTQITNAIDALDSTKEQTAGADGLALKVVEENGKITSIEGSIAANTYDAHGAAAAVQGSTTETVASVDAKVKALGTASAANVAIAAIGSTGEATTALPTVGQVETYVAAAVADLEGAMHFVGVITRNTGESDEDAIARVITAPKPGDVVVMSDNAKEYIYVDPDPKTAGGEVWREVGDEGLYVQKSTTIAGVDLKDSITATELKAAIDVDDIETAIGSDDNGLVAVTDRIKAEAKSATYKAAVPESAEGAGDGVAEVTIAGAISALETAVGAMQGDAGSVATSIKDAIEALDAEKSQAAAADNGQLALTIKEVDGKITEISGSIKANTYDAYGSAATAQSTVVGSSTDTKAEDTVFGAKAYAKDYTDTALTWGTF